MPATFLNARVNELWSVKPHSRAMSATDRSDSRNRDDAAAMRVLVMYWLGVRPKKRLIRRANRAGASPADSANEEGVTGVLRCCSN